MARKNSENSEQITQSQRFVEAARELGCDESEERFDAALRKVAKAPAPNVPEKPEDQPKKRR